MPLCHNVIEAMSVGTIPVIQKEYAEVMYPNLKNGFNAVVFNDLQHMEKLLLDEIFQFKKDVLVEMRMNVLEYYQKFLTPKNVVKEINNTLEKGEMIYLLAEHRSVKILD